MKHKLYCDANYYSSDCSVYCVAKDTDAEGHYTCDPATGRIICRSGMLSARIMTNLLLLVYESQLKLLAYIQYSTCTETKKSAQFFRSSMF